MPVAINDVAVLIEGIAPLELAADWDNSGLLLRCGDHVGCIMIALDVTQAVVDEAMAQGCDMILAHHPTIFAPVKSLSIGNAADAVIMRLIKAGISLYAAHTSYDCVPGGMNDVLAQKLGLRDVSIADGGDGAMRIGSLPQPMSRAAFAQHVKQAIDINCIKTSRGGCDNIDRIAVVGGSGGDFVAAARQAGANALVTGEAKHHHFIEAAALGVMLAVAGHYDTERWFVDDVFMSLQARVNKVQLDLGLKKATCEKAPYVYQ